MDEQSTCPACRSTRVHSHAFVIQVPTEAGFQALPFEVVVCSACGWNITAKEERLQAEVERLRLGGAPGAAGLIAAERKRQIDAEGWTAEHDDRHEFGELALAAACYALTHRWRRAFVWRIWPWSVNNFKPKDRITDLVRAGALIAAEIDRLLRRKDSEAS